MPRFCTLLAPLSMLLLSFWFSPATQAAEGCLKLVFNQYCLGGDLPQLKRQEPDFVHQQQEGERSGVIYPDGRERVYVLALRNRIYKVVRKFHPSTGLKYKDVRATLTGIYGQPREMSQFPEYAKGLGSKIGSIRRGEGQVLLMWQPQGEVWHVELGWTREMGLNLAYITNQQDTDRQKIDQLGY